MNDDALPLQYVRLMADLLSTMGADVPALLAHAQLQPADLQDTQRGLAWPPFERFLQAAVAATREPALGLLVGERLRINTHGMLGYAAMNSATLRQALELLETYLPLRTTLVKVTRSTQGAEVWVGFEAVQALGDLSPVILDAITLTIKNLIDQITFGACEVQRVCLAHPEPAHAAMARQMFGCPVHWGQGWNGLVMHHAALDTPLSSADPAAFANAARLCRDELDRRDAHAPLRIKVRRVMLARQHGFPTLEVVARQFNLTPRTLHRRLIDEGTAFQQILDEVRHHLALQHLQAGQLSLQEIAWTLGYTDAANFRRAFKRWTGTAPSAWRAGASGVTEATAAGSSPAAPQRP